MLLEESLLKNQERDHTRRYRCISDVKYRAKEFEFLAPDEWEPGRELRMNDRKVKHIHYPSMKKARISAGGEDPGNVIIRAVVKYQSVEHAVNKIAKGTGIDQGSANDKSFTIIVSDDSSEIPGAKYNCGQPEKSKKHLAPCTPNLPAPGHPLVFNKIKLEPPQTRYFCISIREMCLNPDLQRLVNYDYQRNNESYVAKLHCLYLSNKYS